MADKHTSVPQVPPRDRARERLRGAGARPLRRPDRPPERPPERPPVRREIPPPDEPLDGAEILDFALQYIGVIGVVIATTVCSAIFVILPIARFVFAP